MATIDAIHGVGLKDAQGIGVAEAFYWDQDDETRAFAKRFYDRMQAMPTQVQAGAYSVVNHYLKAIKAVGSKDPDKVMAKMREIPINDFMSHEREAARRRPRAQGSLSLRGQVATGIERTPGTTTSRSP